MKFRLHWLDGTSCTIEGESITKAVMAARYGAGSIPALDYYEEVNPKPSDLDLAKEALELARGVIDYCGGGDAWERECNQPAMDRFEEICNQLIPPEPEPESMFHECWCHICERRFIHKKALRTHERGATHIIKLLSQLPPQGAGKTAIFVREMNDESLVALCKQMNKVHPSVRDEWGELVHSELSRRHLAQEEKDHA